MAQLIQTKPRVVEHEVNTPTTNSELDVLEVDDNDVALTKFQQLIYLLAGILNGLLAIRFLLLLFGANPLNSFANFIYTVTNPFVAPFRGLFGYTLNLGGSHLEVETVIAIVVYSLLAYVLVRLLGLGKRHVETF